MVYILIVFAGIGAVFMVSRWVEAYLAALEKKEEEI